MPTFPLQTQGLVYHHQGQSVLNTVSCVSNLVRGCQWRQYNRGMTQGSLGVQATFPRSQRRGLQAGYLTLIDFFLMPHTARFPHRRHCPPSWGQNTSLRHIGKPSQEHVVLAEVKQMPYYFCNNHMRCESWVQSPSPG